MNRQNYFLDYIDGAKGLAILSVCLVHIAGLVHNGGYLFQTSKILLERGARGVQLLFMISAFALVNSNTLKYGLQNIKRKLPKNFASVFFIRRLIRIMPLWVILTIVGMLLSHNVNLVSFLYSVSFIFGIIRYLPNTEVIVGGWAVFVEITFYMLFPLILGKVRSLSAALKLLTITVFITVMWRVFSNRFSITTNNAYGFLFPLNHSYPFSLGILFYYINPYIKKSFSAVWANLWTLLVIPMLLPDNFDLSVLVVFVLFVTMSIKDSLMSNLANNPIIKTIGKMSYSIFLLHFFVIQMLERYFLSNNIFTFSNYPAEIRVITWLFILLFICTPLSYMLYYLVELPINKKFQAIIRQANYV